MSLQSKFHYDPVLQMAFHQNLYHFAIGKVSHTIFHSVTNQDRSILCYTIQSFSQPARTHSHPHLSLSISFFFIIFLCRCHLQTVPFCELLNISLFSPISISVVLCCAVAVLCLWVIVYSLLFYSAPFQQPPAVLHTTHCNFIPIRQIKT